MAAMASLEPCSRHRQDQAAQGQERDYRPHPHRGPDEPGDLRLQEGALERNQSKRALAKSVRCGFYFHPADEDQSAGTPVGKSHLAGLHPGTATLVSL